MSDTGAQPDNWQDYQQLQKKIQKQEDTEEQVYKINYYKMLSIDTPQRMKIVSILSIKRDLS